MKDIGKFKIVKNIKIKYHYSPQHFLTPVFPEFLSVVLIFRFCVRKSKPESELYGEDNKSLHPLTEVTDLLQMHYLLHWRKSLYNLHAKNPKQ